MSDEKRGDASNFLREAVTAGIGLAILSVTCIMLLGTFHEGTPDAFNRKKDILLYGVALLGTVAGYYFGRVPAELHAQRAREAEQAAKQNLTAAQQQLVTTSKQEAVADAERTRIAAEHKSLKSDVKTQLRTILPILDQDAQPAKGGTLSAEATVSRIETIQAVRRNAADLLVRVDE